MPIIKNRLLTENKWRYQFEHTSREISTHDIISHQQWHPNAELKLQVAGIALFPEDEIDYEDRALQHLKIIAIIFPSFNEGRGYSQASKIRQSGYKGELRAIGAYRDNLTMLERCGFNAFDLAEGEDVSQALMAFDELELALAS